MVNLSIYIFASYISLVCFIWIIEAKDSLKNIKEIHNSKTSVKADVKDSIGKSEFADDTLALLEAKESQNKKLKSYSSFIQQTPDRFHQKNTRNNGNNPGDVVAMLEDSEGFISPQRSKEVSNHFDRFRESGDSKLQVAAQVHPLQAFQMIAGDKGSSPVEKRKIYKELVVSFLNIVIVTTVGVLMGAPPTPAQLAAKG